MVLKGRESVPALDGHILYKFLSTYYQESEVRFVTVKELESIKIKAINLLICLPSDTTERTLQSISYDRVAVFDYYDEPHLLSDAVQNTFVSGLTKKYLKTSRDSRSTNPNDHYITGLLPLNLSTEFPSEFRQRLSLFSEKKLSTSSDVFFIGSNTYLRKDSSKDYHDVDNNYYQRVEWLLELGKCPDINFFGWLTDIYGQIPLIEGVYGNVKDIFSKRRIRFPYFCYLLSRAKIVLAPTGHARWTYRHIEGMYSRSIIASNDISGLETLMPMPKDHMLMFNDHATISLEIREVLEEYHKYKIWTDHNFDFAERYLTKGVYDSKKRLLLDKFENELQN